MAPILFVLYTIDLFPLLDTPDLLVHLYADYRYSAVWIVKYVNKPSC